MYFAVHTPVKNSAMLYAYAYVLVSNALSKCRPYNRFNVLAGLFQNFCGIPYWSFVCVCLFWADIYPRYLIA